MKRCMSSIFILIRSVCSFVRFERLCVSLVCYRLSFLRRDNIAYCHDHTLLRHGKCWTSNLNTRSLFSFVFPSFWSCLFFFIDRTLSLWSTSLHTLLSRMSQIIYSLQNNNEYHSTWLLFNISFFSLFGFRLDLSHALHPQ